MPLPLTLTWTPSHPERTKAQSTWTETDWEIHLADTIAGALHPQDSAPVLQVYHCNSEDIHAALMPLGTWHWRDDNALFHCSLIKRAQRLRFRQYTQTRDMQRIYANQPTHWSRYNPSLMAMLTKVKGSSPRRRGHRTKHMFDWMAHAQNLSKGSPLHRREELATCSFCGMPETQQHINVACTHPPLAELRRTHQRHIDEFFLTYRHHHLPSNQRWIVPLLEYMEENIWSNTERRGENIWNGRWATGDIKALIPLPPSAKALLTDFKAAMHWMKRLTLLLQRAQTALYSARHIELMFKAAKARRDRYMALRRRTHINPL